MSNAMSNKILACLSGSLIVTIVTIWAIMQHAQQIGDAWSYARWGLLLVAVLSILYGLYRLWHAEHLRKLDRQLSHAQLKRVESEQWALEQRVLTEQEIAQTKESNHLKLELERLRLEQMRATLEHERLMVAASRVTLNEGHMFVVREAGGEYTTISAPRTSSPANQLVAGKQNDTIIEAVFPDPIDFSQVLQTFRPTPQAIYMLHTTDEPITVPMGKVCHVGIGGTTGAGKTNITRMLTAQLLLCQAPIYMANPNYNPVKLNGNHIEDWRPIVRLLKEPVARDIKDINALLARFMQEFEKRKKQADQSLRRGADMFLILCELPAIIAQDKEAADPVVRLLREARQYGIHVISEFQDALVSTIGGSSGARENYRTGYYGGGDLKTAQILLDLGKGERVSEEGIGQKGSVYLRCESTKARPGRVPFFSNQALYTMLGTPPDPMTDDPIFDEEQIPETFCTLTPDGRYVNAVSGAQMTIIEGTIQTRSGVPETPLEFAAVHPYQTRQTGPLDEPEDASDVASNPRLDEVQMAAFKAAYKTRPNLDNALSRAGVGSSYRAHGRLIIQDMKKQGEI